MKQTEQPTIWKKPSSMSNKSDCVSGGSKQYLKGHSCFALPFSQEMPWFTFCACQAWRNKVINKKWRSEGLLSLGGQVNLLAHLWATKHDGRRMYFPLLSLSHHLCPFTKRRGSSVSIVVPTPTPLTRSVLYTDTECLQQWRCIKMCAPNTPLLASGC